MLKKTSLQKKDLDLELEEIEEAAAMAVEEEGACESSSSSSDCDESEAGGKDSNSSIGGGGGGGRGEGETSKDNPPQPLLSLAASPIPQESVITLPEQRKVDSLPSAPEASRQLIQELGERVAEELKISEQSCHKAEGDSGATKPEATCVRSGSSSGIFLEPSPRRNPLLIIDREEDPEDSSFSF